MNGASADPALARRPVLLICLGWIASLAGCAASDGRVTDFPEKPFPQRRGTHGNGAGRS